MNREKIHRFRMPRIAHIHHGCAAAAEGMPDEGVPLVDHDLHPIGTSTELGVTERADAACALRV